MQEELMTRCWVEIAASDVQTIPLPVVKTVLFGGFGLSYNHKTKIDEMRKQNKVVVVFSY